jgi:membrane protein DedA with SNARE-associated domain
MWLFFITDIAVISWIHELLSRLTYSVSLGNPGALAALFSVGILTDIGVPFLYTLEIFLFFASYYVGPLSTHVLLIVLMLLIGRECGATILYWFSLLWGKPLIKWLGRRFPSLQKNLERFRTRLTKRTVLAVAVVRLIPGLLQVPSLVAGAMRLPYSRFIAGVAISSLIYDFALVFLGLMARIGLWNVTGAARVNFIIGSIALILAVLLFFTFRRNFRR